jgi:hypothetical protein
MAGENIEYNWLLGQKLGPKSNGHDRNRKSFWNMLLNTGSVQAHRDPETQEVRNQSYKWIDPFENPGAYQIKSMYTDGDLLSTVSQVLAPAYGVAAGVTDKDYYSIEKVIAHAEASWPLHAPVKSG